MNQEFKTMVEKINKLFPKITKIIANTEIDWYGLHSFDEANSPQIIKKKYKKMKVR